MDKEKFNSMDFYGQLDFINKELSNGKALSQLSKEIGFSNRALGVKFNRKGYYLSENNILEYNPEMNKKDSKGKSDKRKRDSEDKVDKVKNEVAIDNDEISKKEGNELPIDFKMPVKGSEDKSYNEKINKLEEKLNEVYQWFLKEKEKNKEEASFETDIMIPEGELVKKSIRINEEVWKSFDKFCDKNYKKFTKQELLAQALLEFLRNHN